MRVAGYESLISDVLRWPGTLSQNVAHSNPLSIECCKSWCVLQAIPLSTFVELWRIQCSLVWLIEQFGYLILDKILTIFQVIVLASVEQSDQSNPSVYQLASEKSGLSTFCTCILKVLPKYKTIEFLTAYRTRRSRESHTCGGG